MGTPRCRSRLRALAVTATICVSLLAVHTHAADASLPSLRRNLQITPVTDPPPVDMTHRFTRTPKTEAPLSTEEEVPTEAPAATTAPPTADVDVDDESADDTAAFSDRSSEDVVSDIAGPTTDEASTPQPSDDDADEDGEKEVGTSDANVKMSRGSEGDGGMGMGSIAGLAAGCVACVGVAFAFVHTRRRRNREENETNGPDDRISALSTSGTTNAQYLQTRATPERKQGTTLPPRAPTSTTASVVDAAHPLSVSSHTQEHKQQRQPFHQQALTASPPASATASATVSATGSPQAGVLRSYRTSSPLFQEKISISGRGSRPSRGTENYEFALDTGDCPIVAMPLESPATK